MYEAPQAKKFFRKRFSCKYCPGIRWKLGQILVGGSPGFFGGGVSFFLQGGVPDFPKQGRLYPSAPPRCTPMVAVLLKRQQTLRYMTNAAETHSKPAPYIIPMHMWFQFVGDINRK